mmetsp:Transcript_5604/g.13189  ORF Transcript_5604/g.13189 Transcript_5604/m.13189 type:complete len:308 (-) Transcript_5604:160-1083(-)
MAQVYRQRWRAAVNWHATTECDLNVAPVINNTSSLGGSCPIFGALPAATVDIAMRMAMAVRMVGPVAKLRCRHRAVAARRTVEGQWRSAIDVVRRAAAHKLAPNQAIPAPHLAPLTGKNVCAVANVHTASIDCWHRTRRQKVAASIVPISLAVCLVYAAFCHGLSNGICYTHEDPLLESVVCGRIHGRTERLTVGLFPVRCAVGLRVQIRAACQGAVKAEGRQAADLTFLPGLHGLPAIRFEATDLQVGSSAGCVLVTSRQLQPGLLALLVQHTARQWSAGKALITAPIVSLRDAVSHGHRIWHWAV